jgi:uncharacterized membrane protein YdcZ (DUF606 family)
VREKRHGYSAYAVLRAIIGGWLGALYAYGAPLWPFSQLGTASIVIGAVVGALFGAAVRDARR